MSTYFYLECLSHDPPMQSDDEVSQHDDQHVERAIQMAQGIIPIPPDIWGGLPEQFDRNAAYFCRQHPHCVVGLVDEYGRRRPVPGRGPDRDQAVFEGRIARLDAERSEAADRLNLLENQLEEAKGMLLSPADVASA